MEDLSATISQILGDPEKVKQIQAMASSLGLGDVGQVAESPSLPIAVPQSGESAGAPDLSPLSGLLSGFGGAKEDVNAPQESGFDVSALAEILRSGNQTQPESGSAAGGFNIGTLLKLQQAMANVQQNRANIDLLLALKPRLGSTRSKKIDDAIRIMQVIQFLPMLKESGIFGEMDNILGKLGGLTGGLGGLTGSLGGIVNGFGGAGGGIGNLLGALLGGNGRR